MHTLTILQLVIDLTVDGVRYQGSVICPSCSQICHVSQHPQPVISARFIVFSFYSSLQDNQDSCPSPGKEMSVVVTVILFYNLIACLCTRTSLLLWQDNSGPSDRNTAPNNTALNTAGNTAWNTT